MKVFKFYCGEMYYAFAAETKELAIECFEDEIGDQFTVCEEIPESEWDEKIIKVYEDDYLLDDEIVDKSFMQSIRDVICGTHPQMLFTNDKGYF